MTPADQIHAWKHALAAGTPTADPAAPEQAAPDPAAAPELPRSVAGAGLWFDVRPASSEYLLTLGCCQGFTSDYNGCEIYPGFYGYTILCRNPLTQT